MHLAKASAWVEDFEVSPSRHLLPGPAPRPLPSLEDGHLKASQEDVTGCPGLFVLEPSSERS